MFRKIIDYLSRFIVGGLFIFSGLIKLNDPIGTKIKLHEYFEVFSSDFGSFFEIFIPLALPLGIFLIILEIVLGVAVLMNYKMKLSMNIMLALMLFFNFLTFYSAYFNKVTDCGCFGDAIPLTPWQSFYKDVFLMAFVTHLFWYRKNYQSLLSDKIGHILVSSTALVSLVVGLVAIWHLPYIDFRPYKVGASIPQNMIAKEAPILEYTFVKDGKEVTSQQYLMPDAGYEYVSSEIVNEKASTPKITDYQVVSVDGDDFTQQTFEGNKLLFIFYTTEFDDENKLAALSTITKSLSSAEVMVLTSAGEAQFEAYRHEHQIAAPYYFTDATVLKAMIRSNPGVMLLQNGVVLAKWHYNDIPEINEIDALLK